MHKHCLKRVFQKNYACKKTMDLSFVYICLILKRWSPKYCGATHAHPGNVMIMMDAISKIFDVPPSTYTTHSTLCTFHHEKSQHLRQSASLGSVIVSTGGRSILEVNISTATSLHERHSTVVSLEYQIPRNGLKTEHVAELHRQPSLAVRSCVAHITSVHIIFILNSLCIKWE